MDNGLVLDTATGEITFAESLNPYCSGQWSRTARQIADATNQTSLNPYCSGQWSRTINSKLIIKWRQQVLILIVVDNGLVPN